MLSYYDHVLSETMINAPFYQIGSTKSISNEFIKFNASGKENLAFFILFK